MYTKEIGGLCGVKIQQVEVYVWPTGWVSEDWEGLHLMFDNLGEYRISIDGTNKYLLPYEL